MPALHRSSGRDRARDVDGRSGGSTNRFVLTAACAAAATALLVGCGSSSSSSSGTASPTASGPSAVCTQAGEFKAALGQVTSINVVQQGTNGVKAAVDNVQTQFDNLKQAASSQYQSQVDALQTALSNLKSAFSQSNPVTAVANAVGQVNTAAQGLYDAISSSCPNGIPSVSPSPLSVSPS